MNALPYFLVYLTPAIALIGWWFGGIGLWATPVYMFVAIPLADLLGGHDDLDAADRGAHPLFNVAVRAWVPLQLAMIVAPMVAISSGSVTAIEFVALTLAVGLMSTAIGINIAHELMHRKAKGDRILAEILMTSVSYAHFIVEHVNGHHRHVGTPRDPATARLGESLYAFLPRTLWGSLQSAWEIETTRTERRKIPWYSLANRRLRYPLILIATYLVIGVFFGPLAVLFFALQGALASVLLEVINYLEHYGLYRDQLPNGRYESVQPRHSWNSDFRLTNWFLFNLQRHADHHAHANRPYWALRHFPDGPQLPLSYPTMLLIALVPPLWHHMMDHRVEAERQRLVAKAA